MKKILKEGPIFGLMLGLCSSLAITTTLENGIIMGLSVTLILVLSNMIISLLRNIISKTIMIPAYILIISTLVTTLDIILKIPCLYIITPHLSLTHRGLSLQEHQEEPLPCQAM